MDSILYLCAENVIYLPQTLYVMRKILLTMALMLVAYVTMWAQDAVVIYQKNGKVARFKFTEQPVVSYSATDLVMTTTKKSVHFPINMLQKLVFEDEALNAMDIKEVKGQNVESAVQFSFNGETLSITGGEPQLQVYLFNVKGMKVGQYRLDGNGCVEIPTHSLGKDLYLVKTKSFSFKFLKP